MPQEEEMTINERRKYLSVMKARYLKARRGEQSGLLTEMEQVTGMHRKSLLRLLHAPSLARTQRSKQRGRTYGLEVERVILVVWESLDYVCAQRLTPVLLTTAQHLARFGAVRLTEQVQEQLASISEATVERVLRRHRANKHRLPQKGAERTNRHRQAVPMERIAWDQQEPGHFEVDLVQHSGSTGAGLFGFTLQLVDVATGWSERVMVLGKGQAAMVAGFEHLVQRLPFAIRELHPDNGPEFFTDHLLRYWNEKVTGVRLSRSRPYHKNDNRFVEQKNDTLVRQYFGNLRLETVEQIATANRLYEQMWVYYNLFQPVLHLCEKQFVEGKTRRTWDEAKTPYERLKATGQLSAEQQDRLQRLYETTNPLQLREAIYAGLEVLWQESQQQAEQVA